MKLIYEIPKEYKKSLNSIYAWIHWTKRKKIADYWHFITLADIKQLEKIDYRIDIEFNFYFKSRMLDSSNCSFMAKMIEDSFVKNWLLEDDNPNYVRKVTYHTNLIEPKERKAMEWDRVEIIFYKV